MHKFIDNIVAFSLKNKFFIFSVPQISGHCRAISFKHTPVDAFSRCDEHESDHNHPVAGEKCGRGGEIHTIPVEIAMNPVQKKTDIRSTLFSVCLLSM